MALQFPSNPIINQTYQSGSSSTYTWNGTFWQISSPPTQTFVTARTASFATLAANATVAATANVLDTPIYFIENNAAANIGINTNSVTYAGCLRINPQTTGWDLRYYRGGYGISSNQLFVGRTGYWKIKFSLTGQDGGGNNTLLGAHIGVNNTSVCQRYGSVISGAYYTLNLETIAAVSNTGHGIDFKVGTAGGELFTINQYNLSLEYIGS